MLLMTLSNKELEMLKQELKDISYGSNQNKRSIIARIEKITAPKTPPNRNETIGTLIKLFRDKKSNKVEYSRKKLRERYAYQSFALQRKIIDTFLDGTKDDRVWAYRLLTENWDSHFTGKIQALWDTYHEDDCRWVMLHHFSESYLMEHEEIWNEKPDKEIVSSRNPYLQVCLRLMNNPAFTIDDNRLTEKEYYYILAN